MPDKAKKIKFTLNGDQVRAPAGPHAVSAVKAMTNPPVSPDDVLAIDISIGPDQDLPNDGTVDLTDGMALYSKGPDGAHPRRMPIVVDGKKVQAKAESVTGTILRHLVEPPIPQDRDLFRDIDGAPDERIDDDEEVTLTKGAEFYSVPRLIAPGAA